MPQVRKIILIDEDKCTGCGQCIIDCAEGALKIVDGKAKLVSEIYCDGLGACLGSCPENALTLVVREAEAFDEAAVEEYLRREKEKPAESMACGCSGSMIRSFTPAEIASAPPAASSPGVSALGQWPVQLRLLPSGGSLYDGKDLLLLADCTAVADPNLHRDRIAGRTVIMTCPKLDDMDESIRRLSEILTNPYRSLTIAIMEVPCCSGLLHIAQEALKIVGKDRSAKIVKISIKGDVLPSDIAF